ncbi:hypothetical protein C8J57DRAFT_1524369 [Mycena rebaudengoi]|nr:hypothetical protein C8J57DRAFT_1524369 [Mycena rebaudengoi]
MARDYLAIQGSATSAKHAFSSGSLTGTRLCNSLNAEIFEALQLLKSAYRNGHISAVAIAANHINPLIAELDADFGYYTEAHVRRLPRPPTAYPTLLHRVSPPSFSPSSYRTTILDPEALDTAAPAPPRALLAPLTPAAAYPASARAHLGTPKRFVRFLGPPPNDRNPTGNLSLLFPFSRRPFFPFFLPIASSRLFVGGRPLIARPFFLHSSFFVLSFSLFSSFFSWRNPIRPHPRRFHSLFFHPPLFLVPEARLGAAGRYAPTLRPGVTPDALPPCGGTPTVLQRVTRAPCACAPY